MSNELEKIVELAEEFLGTSSNAWDMVDPILIVSSILEAAEFVQPKAEQEPKREPLTDEQIDEATQKWAGHSMVSLDRLIMCREYARAIEAAHGIGEKE